PVFLNQRKKAVDTSIKSDLRSVANEFETYYTDNQAYPTALTDIPDVKLTTGNSVTIKSGAGVAAGTFCVQITNPKGTDTTNGFYYDSDKGGLQAKGTTACS
ncbi:type IV pilin protein, partial [Angustibacter peucedani]